MFSHITWIGWEKTLCREEDWRVRDFSVIKAEYDWFMKEGRIEELENRTCNICFNKFKYLLTLSDLERRNERDKLWEEEISQNFGEHSVDLNTFIDVRLEDMPRKYQGYRWLKHKEKQYKVEEVRIHNITTVLYHEASQCFINGQFLSSILAIGSAIDQLIRQWVDPSYKQKEWIRKENYDEAIKNGYILKEHKKEMLAFKEAFRDQVAHPKSPSFSTLGFVYTKEKIEENREVKTVDYWKSPTGKPIHTGPLEGAKTGLELFWKLVHYYFYVRNNEAS